jgi:hypothetical protein
MGATDSGDIRLLPEWVAPAIDPRQRRGSGTTGARLLQFQLIQLLVVCWRKYKHLVHDDYFTWPQLQCWEATAVWVYHGVPLLRRLHRFV